MESEYLKRTIGSCLTSALTEVVEKRPMDPIEYIAQWLYKYKENQLYAEEELIKAKQLEEEREAARKEQEYQDAMKEEAEKLAKEEEEERKKAEPPVVNVEQSSDGTQTASKDRLLPSNTNLETVMEENPNEDGGPGQAEGDGGEKRSGEDIEIKADGQPDAQPETQAETQPQTQPETEPVDGDKQVETAPGNNNDDQPS